LIPFNDDDVTRIVEWLPAAQRFGADSIQAKAAMSVRAEHIPCTSEADWLSARVNGIGASEVGVVIGASTFTSPYALWWQKKLGWQIPGTEGQRWGHLVEDPIAVLFAEQMAGTLYLAKPLGHPYSLWCHPAQRWAMCTPDRLAVHIDGYVCPVELKSDEGGDGWGEPETDQVPRQYRAQALWQAMVFGSHGTYLVRKRGSGRRRLLWYWVPFHLGEAAVLVTAARDFLASIELGVPPDPDGSKATAETLKTLNTIEEETFAHIPAEVRDEWFAARDGKRDASAREALATNMLRQAMGTAQFATYKSGDGLDVVFAKRRVGKRDGYSVPPGTVDELRRIGGQHEATGPIPGDGPEGADPSAAPPIGEEGTRSGGGPRDGLGASTGGSEAETADGQDPRSTALDE